MKAKCGAYALHGGCARLQARTRVNMSTSPDTHTHAFMHARTQRQICNIYCFSTARAIREKPSELRYTYICVSRLDFHSAPFLTKENSH